MKTANVEQTIAAALDGQWRVDALTDAVDVTAELIAPINPSDMYPSTRLSTDTDLYSLLPL